MKSKVVWQVLGGLMVATLMLASCTSAITEEEEVTPQVQEEVAEQEEEKVLKPAEFKVENLVVLPDEVTAGESTTVTVDVTNIGEVGGDYEVTLTVDGEVTEAKKVTLTTGATETVSFTLIEEAGTYVVSVDGLSGILTVSPTPAPAQEDAKQITIIYVEDDNPISEKEVWLSYYDEKAQTWITEKKITDEEGMATFNVPEGESGESATFTFAFSEAEVNERTQDIEARKRMGWRIPPDPLQTKLILKVDKDFKISVVAGAFQTWIPEF